MNNPGFFVIWIPCYNEEEAILPLSERLDDLRETLSDRQIDLKVIWVNDKSTDGTLERITQARGTRPYFEVINHTENRGLVGVLETVLAGNVSHLEDSRFWGFGLFDGDDSHDPRFFIPMLENLNRGFDVVVASRFQKGAHVVGVSWDRRLFSWGMSALFQIAGRIPGIRDYSCGFRVYSPRIAKRIANYKFKNRSFACMVELLVLCHRNGARCTEVPFDLRYDLKKSASKMRVVRTIYETLGVLSERNP